jgi:hypothetical protein
MSANACSTGVSLVTSRMSDPKRYNVRLWVDDAINQS